jgi:hypothetical protein
VDGGQGAEIEATRNLFKRRRVAVLLHESADEIEHLTLTPGHGHEVSIENKRRICKSFVCRNGTLGVASHFDTGEGKSSQKQIDEGSVGRESGSASLVLKVHHDDKKPSPDYRR